MSLLDNQTTRTLNEYDRADLLKHAIDPDWALDNGRAFSAEKPEDLPPAVRPDDDDLSDDEWERYVRWRNAQTPCLVICHTEPIGNTGDTRTVYEVKPRRETLRPGAPKYAQDKGTGTVRSITPGHFKRINGGAYTEVWFIEGTQQAMVAQRLAPDHVVVIGMKGCTGWALKGGILPGPIRSIIRNRVVRILMDADMGSNLSVWTAAKTMRDACIVSGGAAEVHNPLLPGSGKTGLDDVLAEQSDDTLRAEELNRLMSAPAPTMPRKPPAKAKKLSKTEDATRVDWEGCRVVRVPILVTEDGEEEEGRPFLVANAAHRIEEIQTVLNDRRRTVTKPITKYGIRSAILDPATGQRVESSVYPVTPQELLKPEEWLATAAFDDPRLTAKLTVADGYGRALHNAIKENEYVAAAVTYQRTPGYRLFQGKHVYTCTQHSITGEGVVTELRTDFSKDGGVNLPAPGRNDTEMVARMSRIFIELRNSMVRPGAYVASLAHALAPLAQIDPVGMTVHQGVTNSGKTSIMHLVARTVRGATAELTQVDDTVTVIGDAAKGSHNTAVFIDDGRDHVDAADQAHQDRGIARATRISTESASRSRARSRRTADDDYVVDERDTAFPAMQVSTERQLNAGSASDLNRQLPFYYYADRPVFATSKQAVEAIARAKEDYYSAAIADLISLNCWALDEGRKPVWNGEEYKTWAAAFNAAVVDFETEHKVSNRTAKVAASRILAAEWVRWLIHPLKDDELDGFVELDVAVTRFVNDVTKAVTKAARHLEDVTLRTETPAVQLAGEIKQLLAGNKATTVEQMALNTDDRRPVILTRQDDKIYLFPGVVVPMLAGKMTGSALTARLAQHSGLVIKERTTTRVGGVHVPAMALDAAVWDTMHDTESDEDFDDADIHAATEPEPEPEPEPAIQLLPTVVKSRELSRYGLKPQFGDGGFPTGDAGEGRIWVTQDDSGRWANWARDTFDSYSEVTGCHSGLYRRNGLVYGVVSASSLNVFIGACGGRGDSHLSCDADGFCGSADVMQALATKAA